jgi:tRNA (guanine-N(7)-)-methyltransferase subunit TRM82
LQKCGSILLAATSSRVDSFSIEDGSRLSAWTFPTSLDEKGTEVALRTGGAGKRESSHPAKLHQANAGLNSEPPAKKRRLSDPIDTEETISVKPTRHQKTQQNSTFDRQWPPAVIALDSTRGGEHVIAVTGEDKSIRVFLHDGRGQVRHISQRYLLSFIDIEFETNT